MSQQLSVQIAQVEGRSTTSVAMSVRLDGVRPSELVDNGLRYAIAQVSGLEDGDDIAVSYNSRKRELLQQVIGPPAGWRLARASPCTLSDASEWSTGES